MMFTSLKKKLKTQLTGEDVIWPLTEGVDSLHQDAVGRDGRNRMQRHRAKTSRGRIHRFGNFLKSCKQFKASLEMQPYLSLGFHNTNHESMREPVNMSFYLRCF